MSDSSSLPSVDATGSFANDRYRGYSGLQAGHPRVHRPTATATAREVASAPWGASFLAEEDGDYLVRVAAGLARCRSS